MKKQLTVLLASAISVVAVAQQKEPPPPPSIEDRMEHFSTMLDKEVPMKAEQKKKVLAVYKDFFLKMDQLRAKYPPPPPPPAPPAEMKREMDQLVADKDAKMKAALSADQFSKLKQIEEQRRRMGHSMPPPPPPPM